MSPKLEKRLTGIVILAVLQVLGGLTQLGAGLFLVFVAVAVFNAVSFIPILASASSSIYLALGIVALALSGAAFFLAYSLWKGKLWARKITLILALINLVLTLPSIIGPIINGLIIYYLRKPHVKEFFMERQPLTQAGTPDLQGPTPSVEAGREALVEQTNPASSQIEAFSACPHCGTPPDPDPKCEFCHSCWVRIRTVA